jgi:hypothetical protein
MALTKLSPLPSSISKSKAETLSYVEEEQKQKQQQPQRASHSDKEEKWWVYTSGKNPEDLEKYHAIQRRFAEMSREELKAFSIAHHPEYSKLKHLPKELKEM